MHLAVLLVQGLAFLRSVASFSAAAAAAPTGTCSCDDSPQAFSSSSFSNTDSDRNYLGKKNRIRSYVKRERSKSQFMPAKVAGEDYIRPFGGVERYSSKRLSEVFEEQTDPNCNSDQIHINLGDDLESFTVSFVSYSLNTESVVYYSTSEDDLITHSSNVKSAKGTHRAHSELIYITGNLIYPYMGEPLATAESIIELEDTSTWAYDKKTGEHWFNWRNVTTLETGFGKYNNPYMYYDSPIMHTVILPDLKAQTTYFYRVSGSCKTFHFKTPPFYYGSKPDDLKMYPFAIGLVGDLGQTEVSFKSMQALVDIDPDAVILVGDLSYAGCHSC
jgi:hypothetical protein